MSKKQLHPITWNRGQTDGDVSNGAVSQLLNCEIDQPGRLRSRDGWDRVGFTEGAKLVAIVSSDPTKNNLDGWEFTFTFEGILVTPITDDVDLIDDLGTDLDYPDSSINIRNSTVSVHGETVYVAAVDDDDNQLGMFSIWCPQSEARFTPPKYLEDDSMYDGELTSDVNDWMASILSKVNPTLSMVEIEDNEKALDIDPLDELRSSALSSAEVNLTTNKDNACSLVYHWSKRTTDTMYGEGAFDHNSVVEFIVQYIFFDGELSSLSDSTRIEAPGVAGEKYFLDLTVALHRAINSAIKGVIVYRRVIINDTETSNDFKKMFVAWLDKETIETLTEDLGSSESVGMTFGVNQLDGVTSNQGPWKSTDGGSTWEEYSITDGSDRCFQLYTADNVYRCIGWKKYGTIFHYCLPHYGGNGKFHYSPIAQVVWLEFDAIWATGFFGERDYAIQGDNFATSVLKDTYVMGSSRLPLHEVSNPYNYHAVGPVWGEDSTPADPVDNDHPTEPWPIELYSPGVLRNTSVALSTLDRFESTNSYWNLDDSESTTSDCTQLVMYRDRIEPRFETVTSVNGVSPEKMVDIKPRSFTIAGNRLIMVDALENELYRPDVLFYSTFGRFGLVSEDNTIDYGSRDTGKGVAVVSYRNNLIVLHSTAMYIMDISGGSDMSWREKGAITTIGLLDIHAICLTPSGPVWGDRQHVYWFNGTNVLTLTKNVELQIDVSKTYRDKVRETGLDGIMYRHDSRQVWVCFKSFIMVCDLDTGAWHEHLVEDLVADTISRLISSVDYFGNQRMYVEQYVDDDSVLSTFEINREAFGDTSFVWGINSGNIPIGAPEVIKKGKRIYINTIPDNSTIVHLFNASITGDEGGSISGEYFTKVDGGQTRISGSVRGYHIAVEFMTPDGDGAWTGVLDSLGMSYKLKTLK